MLSRDGEAGPSPLVFRLSEEALALQRIGSLRSVQEIEYGIRRSLEPWGAGCLQVSLQVSMVPCPTAALSTAGAHWSLMQSQNKGGQEETAIIVGKREPWV